MICLLGYIELIAICILAIGMIALFYLNHRNYKIAKRAVKFVDDLMEQTMKNQKLAQEGIARVTGMKGSMDSVQENADIISRVVGRAIAEPAPPTIPDPAPTLTGDTDDS